MKNAPCKLTKWDVSILSGSMNIIVCMLLHNSPTLLAKSGKDMLSFKKNFTIPYNVSDQVLYLNSDYKRSLANILL